MQEAKARRICRAFRVLRCETPLVVGRLHNQMIDHAVRFVDVVQGAVAQAAHRGIVLLAGNVIVRLIQQFERAVKTAGPVHVFVDRRVIVQVLAVVNRGPFDFVDGAVNLVDGALFLFVHVIGGGGVVEMSAGVAQVGQGMQVSGMPSRFVGEGGSGAESDNKYDYGAMSYSFHELLWDEPGSSGFDSVTF